MTGMAVGHERVTAATQSRGQTLPLVAGVTPDGAPISLRDYYMRRNMAVVVVGDDEGGRRWLLEAANQQEAAQREAGTIVAIVPSGVDAHGLPAIVDEDGRIVGKLGLSGDDLPALFLIDRFGTIFATNVGPSQTADLRPRDIPGWLEFIACRCS